MIPRSLAARLSLSLGLLVLLTVGLMTFLAVWNSAAVLRGRVHATNLTVAHGVSRAVEQYLTDALAIMKEASERPKLRQEINRGNWPEAQTVVENILRHFHQFDYSYIQDAQGIVRVRVPRPDLINQDLSHRDSFREAVRTRQPFLSDAYISQVTGKPVIAIAVPVVQPDGHPWPPAAIGNALLAEAVEPPPARVG